MILHLSGTPNPKQERFFLATARHIAYGGARGGGKSWAMRRKFVLLAFRYAGLRLLLLRRTLPELNENHVLPLQKELTGAVTYLATQRAFLFPNGSRIKLGYCDREADVFQYQGQEYDVIGLEEATHFTETQMQFLTTCNRSVRTDFSPRMYYTCNPGGVGHAWVKRLFIDRDYRNCERAEDYVFIPARVTDNPVLLETNPQYLETLENLPEHLKKAYLDGNWDVLEGQFFPEFDRSVHVVRPTRLPMEWKRFRAMDWGYNDPCCVLWFAVAPEGKLYVYRELYLRKTLDNARIPGWQRVREALAKQPDGAPELFIFETCRNLIRTLPQLTFDTRDAEDVSDACEDHAPEALRYGLMSRPRPAPEEKRKRPYRYDPLAGTPQFSPGFYGL